MGGPLLTVPLLAPRIELAHSWCMVRMCGWETPTILACPVVWFTVALTYRWDCHRQDMATSLDLSHSTSRFLRSCVLPQRNQRQFRTGKRTDREEMGRELRLERKELVGKTREAWRMKGNLRGAFLHLLGCGEWATGFNS